jgi:hypothetical protein
MRIFSGTGVDLLGSIQRFLRRSRYGEPVVVVSGLPRSGTSMMMKMLGAGGLELATDEIRSADEDNPKGYFELEKVKELDKTDRKDWVAEYRGKVIKVISFLLRDLPDDSAYKVIFMRRNLDEVIASQNKMLDRRGESRGDDDEKMIELYETHLRKVEFLLRGRKNFETLDVDYKQALEKPREHAERVRRFLGVPLDVGRMAEVVDPDLYRNRR